MLFIMNTVKFRICLFTIFPILLATFFINSCSAQSKSEEADKTALSSDASKMLIFSKTEGYRHASIPDGVDAVSELAADNNIRAHHTEDAGIFTSDSLSNYSVILFLSTTGDILDEQQQEAFETFIQNGGGFVGIHAAADTEYEWPWYGDLVGAYFESHPEIQEARMEVLDKNHPSTSHLPDEWIRTDEWYNYKDINPDINVLINLDESSYNGGKNGDDHPIAWYHEYEGGRIFYTGGGHTVESYSEPLFMEHVLGGIKYVLGQKVQGQ